MSLPVRILPRARVDFRDIYSYIEQRSPSGAARWRKAFEDGMRRVSDNPERFGLAPEDENTRFLLRQLLFKTKQGLIHRAVFTVLDDEVLVLRIRGPGQPLLNEGEIPLG